MKVTRRKFGRLLALAAAGTPLVVNTMAQTRDQVSADAVELGMKVIDVKVSAQRAEGIRQALRNTDRQVAAIRAYPVKRDTQPALVLGVFDA
jgi:hypothetical protein